ncbi:MAG: hypothetical protein KatS3mg102_0701 [Planctomycetota bacterium]|nr:MAG: hypothetical protein KatS3mg102_0701 [Planctomycetota bacterium]
MNRSTPARGFTMVELTVTLGLLAVISVGTIGAVRAGLAASADGRDAQLAFHALRAEVEANKALSVRGVLARFGGRTERSFEVAGLQPPAAGQSTGTVRLLSEQQAALLLGIPGLDLNFNGIPAESTLDASYKVLVMVVRVAWRSPTGTEAIELVASVAEDMG